MESVSRRDSHNYVVSVDIPIYCYNNSDPHNKTEI